MSTWEDWRDGIWVSASSLSLSLSLSLHVYTCSSVATCYSSCFYHSHIYFSLLTNMYMYYNAIRKPYLYIMGNLWIHTSCCVHCDTIVFNLFWTFNITIMIHVHTYTYNVRLHAHVTTGNRTYVGYVYTEITINNAIVRVFVKIMQDVVDCKKTSFPRGRGGAHLRLCSQSPTTPDYSSDACDDGEFVMLHVYSIHTVSSVPGCTQAWALRPGQVLIHVHVYLGYAHENSVQI